MNQKKYEIPEGLLQATIGFLMDLAIPSKNLEQIKIGLIGLKEVKEEQPKEEKPKEGDPKK